MKCSIFYVGHITQVVRSEDQYAVKILLGVGKKAITRKWLKPEPPNQSQWVDRVQEILCVMEKMTLSEAEICRV